MNLKEIIDNVLNEEEGGEFLRFNNIKFYISGRTDGLKLSGNNKPNYLMLK